ncbi:hypothetical protein [Aliarcobacter butzleri]|uniref:hypothetical protein n=1 Tax=Aliarcobacter butzleri TaxID=28197 RepID=UPI003BAF3317
MIRKYILFLPIILFFVSCADKERNLSSSDVIGCRMMELQGNTFFITAPIGALVQKTGNLFKDEEEQKDLKDVCNEVRYGKMIKKIKEKEELEQKTGNEISNPIYEIVKENQEINN